MPMPNLSDAGGFICYRKRFSSSAKKDMLNHTLELIQTKLQKDIKYKNAYEIEKATKLVVEIK